MEYSTWDHMVYEYGDSIGRKVTYRGGVYTFFGLVFAEDDLYYGLCGKPEGMVLLSAVGDMDSWEVELVDGEWPERLKWREWIAAGGPRWPDNMREPEAPSDE